MAYLLLASAIILGVSATYFWRRGQQCCVELAEEQRRNQQLELLISYSSSIVVLLNRNLQPLYIHDNQPQAASTDINAVPAWLASVVATLRSDAMESLSHGGDWQAELVIAKDTEKDVMSASASPLLDDTGALESIVLRLENITSSKDLANQLFVSEHFHSLTELPNRQHALIKLSDRIEQCKSEKTGFMLLHIDLDRIRFINDIHGHQVVDQLFVDTADRLRRCVRGEQDLAHLGADEFLIILEAQSCEEEASILADVILERITEPYHIRNKDIRITASIGMARFPRDGDETASLLRRAESAMYEAKRQGGNRFCRFESAMTGQLVQRVKLENHLRQAIEHDELELFYQPLIDARSNTLHAVEVLLRWHKAKLKNPSPELFIPVAEETGLIAEIGNWVLLNACRQAMIWRRAGLPPIKIAINISARQFEDQAIVNNVRYALKQSGLPASSLELEVTEGLLIRDSDDICDSFRALKEMGVLLSLDDFGTGYASLSYLKRYPFDIVKIDRSFIHDIETCSESLTLVNAIIAMAHNFDMPVVAEGVETEQQRRLLKERGCDYLQGYLYSRPVDADAFGDWARDNRQVLAS